jgi:hypothetical protein
MINKLAHGKQHVNIISRCLVDGGFGRVKKLFKRSDCDTLAQFAEIINKSGQRDFPVLFRNQEGEQTWIW